jgi:hypothetical protein
MKIWKLYAVGIGIVVAILVYAQIQVSSYHLTDTSSSTWLQDQYASEYPSTPTPTESPKPTPAPKHTKKAPVYVPELEVYDLGSDVGNCNKYDTCTFVDIVANKTCRNASIILDLYDDNDNNYDTDQADIGTVYKGQKLHKIEVGSDDPDAWSVDASDFTCG